MIEMITEWQNQSRCKEAMEHSLAPLEKAGRKTQDIGIRFIQSGNRLKTMRIRIVLIVAIFYLPPYPQALK